MCCRASDTKGWGLGSVIDVKEIVRSSWVYIQQGEGSLRWVRSGILMNVINAEFMLPTTRIRYGW